MGINLHPLGNHTIVFKDRSFHELTSKQTLIYEHKS